MARDPWLDALRKESEALRRWCRELDPAELTPREAAELIEEACALSRDAGRLRNRAEKSQHRDVGWGGAQ